MRLSRHLWALTLPVFCLAAKKASVDTFTKYNTKPISSGPIKVNDAVYRELTAAPRDYSTVMLMTAMDPKYGCGLCREFAPEWDMLVKSWRKGDKKSDSRLLLSTLDFADGRGIFQELSLNTAPLVFFFPPTTGPHAAADPTPVKYDFAGLTKGDEIRNWIVKQMPDRPHPAFVRPVDWMRVISITTGVLGTITAIYVAGPYLMPVLQSRNLWAAVSLLGVLLFTSGFMFNHIRKVPYVAAGQGGKISYFAGGFQNQYGLETQIMAVVYGALAFATVSLALKVPRMTDPKSQQIAVFLWSGMILCVYSFLISTFKIKNGSYPFFLPPF